MADDITSILDARLPQPYEWQEMLPAHLVGVLRALSHQRSTVPDAQIDTIDHEMLRLLMPYRKDVKGPEIFIRHSPNGREIRFDRRIHKYIVQPHDDNYWIEVETLSNALDAYWYPERYR